MRAFLLRIYAFKFLDSFILILPFYAVMFADAGLTPSQISWVLICWSGTTFLVQTPAGVLADRWPRRHMLALAQVMLAACFAVWWAAPGFWGFLVGLVLWGVKSGFTGGTFEALLYDELKAAGRAVDYAQVFGRARAVQAVALILASLGAAAVGPFGYGAALAASIAASLLAAATVASLPPAARSLGAGDRAYLAHLRDGLHYVLTQRSVLAILAFSAAVLALGAGLEEFWPIFGLKVGLARSWIAVFVAVQQALEAGGSLLAHRFQPRRMGVFHATFAVAGSVLALAALWFNQPAMALLALYSGLTRLLDVALEARLQHQIPSESRATIGSVKGLASQLGVSSMYLVLGPLAQATSYRTAFLACGLAGVAIALGFLTIRFSPRAARPA